jgi:hypothetical protein
LHADLGTGLQQALDIGSTDMLHAAIEAMNPACCWLALTQRPVQSIQSQLAIQPARELPADAAA